MATLGPVRVEGYGSYRRPMCSESFYPKPKKHCVFDSQASRLANQRLTLEGNCTITESMVRNGSLISKNMKRVNGMPSVLEELRCSVKQSGGADAAASGQEMSQKKRRRGGLKCYACGEWGSGVQVSHHLIFGEVECLGCKVKFTSCHSFRESSEAIINSVNCNTCKHLFKFCNPFDYLHDRISVVICRRDVEKLSTSRVFRKLSRYLDKIKFRCDRDPWRSAALQCVEVLKEMRAQRVGHVADSGDICIEYAPVSPEEQDFESQVMTDNGVPSRQDEDGEVGDILMSESFNINQLEEIIEYHVAEDVPTTFVKVEYEDDIENVAQTLDNGNVIKEEPNETPLAAKISSSQMPSDGYYLVTKQAIEECPMCYKELCPSKFTLNVKTFILTTVCTGCNLVIYFPVHGPHLGFPSEGIDGGET